VFASAQTTGRRENTLEYCRAAYFSQIATAPESSAFLKSEWALMDPKSR